MLAPQIEEHAVTYTPTSNLFEGVPAPQRLTFLLVGTDLPDFVRCGIPLLSHANDRSTVPPR